MKVANAPVETLSALALAQQVAPFLSDGDAAPWKPAEAPNENYAYLVRGDGAKLSLYVDPYPGRASSRIEIRGAWPKYGDGRVYTPSREERVAITVDARRKPVEITKEIERRLLPSYEKAFALAVERVREADTSAETAFACANDLAELFGGVPVSRAHPSGVNYVHSKREHVYRLTVTPRDPTGPLIDLHLNGLTKEQTVKILALLPVEREQP